MHTKDDVDFTGKTYCCYCYSLSHDCFNWIFILLIFYQLIATSKSLLFNDIYWWFENVSLEFYFVPFFFFYFFLDFISNREWQLDLFISCAVVTCQFSLSNLVNCNNCQFNNLNFYLIWRSVAERSVSNEKFDKIGRSMWKTNNK